MCVVIYCPEHCFGKKNCNKQRGQHKTVSPDAKYFPLESKDKDVTAAVWPERTATCCFVATSQRRMLLSFEPAKIESCQNVEQKQTKNNCEQYQS